MASHQVPQTLPPEPPSPLHASCSHTRVPTPAQVWGGNSCVFAHGGGGWGGVGVGVGVVDGSGGGEWVLVRQRN